MIPRRECILYTRHDGGVSITHPMAECIDWMARGGIWGDRPKGYVDEQIRRQIEAGHHPRAATRFAHAVAFGGCTDAEALEIIRDRDCGHLGTAFELLDVSEVPSDRWFRDAWRRSHNGGPIGIDVRAARRIQAGRIKGALQRKQIEYKHGLWWPRLRRVAEPAELKQIWPRGIDANV